MTIQKDNVTASLVNSLITGTAKHFSTTSSLVFGGATYTLASLTALLQSVLSLVNAVSAARVAYQAAVKTRNVQMPGLLVIVHAYVSYIRATFGNSPDTLQDFGLLAHKQGTPKTVAEKAEAVAKNLATRAARHTMGSNQKDAIKGTVPTEPATVTTPATTK